MLDKIKIKGGQTLKGSIKIPPSKSLSHRALIAAGLSEGGFVDNIIDSEDIIATKACLGAMGVDFDKKGEGYSVKGVQYPIHLKSKEFACNESGSTLRFMIPIAMLAGEKVHFTGQGKLTTRPLDPYFDIFKNQNIPYNYKDSLPLEIEGCLKPGVFEMPGNISSQFITGLLYTLPLLDGDSVLNITTNLESKGYVDLTLDVLKAYGIHIENLDYEQFTIKGNQTYRGIDYRVEGDYSQVAFWLVAGLINGQIRCLDMLENSSQGDREVIEILERMGANLTIGPDFIQADKSVTHTTVIDGSQCPDIIPVLTVLAAVTPGQTKIVNAERLRIKECDRLHAIASELNKLGADVTELKDGLLVNGKTKLKGGHVQGWNDHRIVMSMAIASLACEEDVIIEDCHAINKSYPHFFEDFEKLGGLYHEWHLEV